MSDVSNDELRIKEIQEAQRRAEKQRKAADQARQTERSFRETMTQRAARQRGAREADDVERRRRAEGDARRVLDQVRGDRKERRPHELAKRAALARAFGHKKSLSRRAQESAGEARVLHDRAEQHRSGRVLQNEHVETELHEEDRAELDVREERLEEVRRELSGLEVAEDLARERRRQDDRSDRDGRDQDEPQVEAAAAAATRTEGSAGPRPSLPPEMLKRIAGAILKAAEDGRVSLRVRLQGPGLEGVEIEVRNEEGQVSCCFSGCNDRLRRSLEQSAPALKRALAKRGFTLAHLEAQ